MRALYKATLPLVLSVAATLGGCLTEELPSVSPQIETGAPSNTPPTISGDPASAVLVGNVYSFTPNAFDADGDVLTFSVANLPAWANFNTVTGELSGQPTLSDIGVFQQIVITVADGTDATSTPDFSITVSQIALGSMTLSWSAPTANTDGSPLTDLSGFRIYYGNKEGVYPNRVTIDTAGISTYVINNLVPDTYYVVATAVNSKGVESSYSNVATKLVQ